MSLVVEDGSGKSNAESYLSEADFRTYWTKHGNPLGAEGLSESDAEDCLRRATQWIDMIFGRRFVGQKASSAQALRWPRLGAETDEGFSIESTELPQSLLDAVAEAARRAISTELYTDLPAAGNVIEEEKQLGDMKKKIKYSGVKDAEEQFPKVSALLRPILVGENRILRG